MADTRNFNDFCIDLATNSQQYHPVATNHFTVTIRLPENLVNQADPQKRLVSETLNDSILTLKIASDSIGEPAFKQSTLEYKKGNLTIKFPGTIDAFNGQAKFHVFVTKSAYDILYSWKMASGNHLTGEVGDPEDYWADVDIDITTGNKGTLVGTWKWHNVWLSSLEGVTFQNGANETKTCSVTMEYFRPEYIGGQYTNNKD